jgi:hypothetical protein
MSRSRVLVPPDAIRIEDEVWQEAFTRREPSRSKASRQLRPVEDRRAEPSPRVASAAEAPEIVLPELEALPSLPSLPPTPSPRRQHTDPPIGPRTVQIRGRGAERNLPWPDASRRRPPRRAYERAGFRPDRVAMWAVILGLLLVLVAVMSAH